MLLLQHTSTDLSYGCQILYSTLKKHTHRHAKGSYGISVNIDMTSRVHFLDLAKSYENYSEENYSEENYSEKSRVLKIQRPMGGSGHLTY